MHPGDILQLIGVGTVALAALSVVVGATVRFSLLPLIRARRLAAAPPPDTSRVEARMDALEEEVRHLGQALERVAQAVEFDAQLRAPTTPETPRLPGGQA